MSTAETTSILTVETTIIPSVFLSILDTCPLCYALLYEQTLYQDDNFSVIRTKTMKGHIERLMIIYTRHQATINNELIGQAHMILRVLAQKLFGFTDYVYILEQTFATIRTHWHLVMSDLGGEDIDQMRITGWTVVPIVKGLAERLKWVDS